ncbi:hypothetical protein PS2_031132 [Malus domestica]
MAGIMVEQTGSVLEGCMEGKNCVPALPWINGDETINKIFDMGLGRLLLGIVMQSPGILRDEIIRKIDVLNPQVCLPTIPCMTSLSTDIVRQLFLLVQQYVNIQICHGVVENCGSGWFWTSIFMCGSCANSKDPPWRQLSTPRKEVVHEHFFANSINASFQ